MKIYGFPLSPFVRKVLVATREKGLDAELVPTNPHHDDEDFRAISPFGKIPAFRDGDVGLADSTAIVTYLDAQYPEAPLLPAAPEARAKAVWFEEVADTILFPAGSPIVVNRFLKPRIFGTEGDEAAALAGEEALAKPLAYLEGAVGDEWIGGAHFTVGDIAIASAIRTLGYAGWEIDGEVNPRVAAWYERVRSRAGWQDAAKIENALSPRLGSDLFCARRGAEKRKGFSHKGAKAQRGCARARTPSNSEAAAS